jgi:spore germination cell wall hydrolase CwlJ-like protein
MVLSTAIAVNKLSVPPIRVSYSQLSEYAKQEVKCLADNIYFESAHEPEDGRVAVAMVTMNRVTSSNYSGTVCGVVKEKINSTCQFSWWCQERERTKAISGYLTLVNDPVYNKAMDIAIVVYLNYGNLHDPSKGALFYHADYVNPKWRNLKVSTKIGRHIFYVPTEKFKKGDVPNGTYDEEIKLRTVHEQRSGEFPLFLLADGRN